MNEESTKIEKNTTLKRQKIHRLKPKISRKIIAFEELIGLEKHKKSSREVAKLLEIPNSTMRSWRKHTPSKKVSKELEDFFSTPQGTDFLQRNIVAVMKLMKCGPSGIRGVQIYLHNTGLDHFIASSTGALQNFWERCVKYIIQFGDREEKRLSVGMKRKKITAGLDEMFRGRRPCLVAIEAVSNYIILEKFTNDRTASTWKKELEPRLGDLNIEVSQVVSDLCGAIRAVTKDFGAEHISELFHAVHEIHKATSGPLASQKRATEKKLIDVKEKIQKLKEKSHSLKKEEKKRQVNELKQAVDLKNNLQIEFEIKSKRQEKVKNAAKEMGKIHHPINLKSGSLQTAEGMEKKFAEQFEIIAECMNDAGLSQRSFDRIEKAWRAFGAIVVFLKYFFVVYANFVGDLKLNTEQEKFFNEIVFPLSYLKMVWSRLSKEVKNETRKTLEELDAKIRDGPFSEEVKKELLKKGRELAEMYQRSSSFVEGRNGVLSLNYHRFHRLSERSLRVLSIVHNFDTRRSDGTTPAERLFEAKHDNLFESLVANVRIPGKPQKQYHDLERRQIGWEKRRKMEEAA